jgi:hypothetical protein
LAKLWSVWGERGFGGGGEGVGKVADRFAGERMAVAAQRAAARAAAPRAALDVALEERRDEHHLPIRSEEVRAAG